MDVQQLIGAEGRTPSTASGPDGIGLLAGPARRRSRRTVEHGPEDSSADAGPRTAPGPGRAVLLAGTLLAALACAAAVVAMVAGARWFVVETPSMGVAAPVGSLVVTTPAPARLLPGAVIAFTPPGPARTYTHRVLSVAADGGIRTKGDVNPDPDAWTIRRSAVLGEAVAILPGAGYLLRGLPALIAGAALVWLATAWIGRRDHRASARVTGLHLVTALVVLWLQPFVRVVVVTAVGGAEGTRAAIVSTGVLPVRLVDATGALLARLTTGRPQVVVLPRSSGGAAERITAVADLDWQLQALLIGLAVLPSLVVLLVGLPPGPRDRA